MKESRLTTLIIFLILNSLCIKGASTEFPQRGEYFFMLQISDEALVEIFAKNLLISRVEDKCVIFYVFYYYLLEGPFWLIPPWD